MKKLTVLLLAFSLIFAFAAGCEQQKEEEKQDEKKEDVKEEEKQDEKKEDEKKEDEKKEDEKKEDEGAMDKISVALVTDTGGIDDKSFNQLTWEGILKFYKDNGWDEKEAQYLYSEAEADYVPNLSNFADNGEDLIVAPGFKFNTSLTDVAANYPDQKFLLIDSVVEAPNVLSATFAEHEGSFLVGVAAALKAKEAGSDMVGFIGGEDSPLINKFEAGFEQGVKAVDENMKIEIEYAGSFGDIAKGQTLAAKMYDKGCHVIYHAAGGTGNGLFKEAIDRAKNGEDVWACGVDKDQYADGIYDEAGEKSVILTSMMKRVDVAAYDVAKMVLDGSFKGGEIMFFNLANGGVGIPEENPNLKAEWVDTVNEYADKIVNGEIEVDQVPARLK